MERPPVVLLAGGDSPERLVSLASGANCAAALREAGYAVQLLDPAECPLRNFSWPRGAAAFLALHGGAGEDGRVQQQLRELGIPYTGSGPAASRLAMNKSVSKEEFRRAALPTPAAVLLTEPGDAQMDTVISKLGLPLVVKPNGAGSSVGVAVVRRPEELAGRVAAAADVEGGGVLCEEFIGGREFTVALLEEQPLPLLEILTSREFFDYTAKYSDENTEVNATAELPAAVAAEIEKIAVRAAVCLGVRGLSRVDLRLDAASRPWLLEVNTLPGMTRTSLAPNAARRAGLSLAALCDWMMQNLRLPEEP